MLIHGNTSKTLSRKSANPPPILLLFPRKARRLFCAFSNMYNGCFDKLSAVLCFRYFFKFFFNQINR
jgi:hypothetical protein